MEQYVVRDMLIEVNRYYALLLKQTGAMIHEKPSVQKEWQLELERCERQSEELRNAAGFA